MEKRISYQHFQQVKNVAKAINPFVVQKQGLEEQLQRLSDEQQAREEEVAAKWEQKIQELIAKKEESIAAAKQKVAENLQKKKEAIQGKIKEAEDNINLYEIGIVKNIGFHVCDLVKKTIEPTGKFDANGKPLKVTKYVETNIVAYDPATKEYVVTCPDEMVVPPTTAGGPGSDFDKDRNTVEVPTVQTKETEIQTDAVFESASSEEAPATQTENKNSMPWE